MVRPFFLGNADIIGELKSVIQMKRQLPVIAPVVIGVVD